MRVRLRLYFNDHKFGYSQRIDCVGRMKCNFYTFCFFFAGIVFSIDACILPFSIVFNLSTADKTNDKTNEKLVGIYLHLFFLIIIYRLYSSKRTANVCAVGWGKSPVL